MLVLEAGDSLGGVAGTASAVTVTVTGVSVTTGTGAETFGKLYQGQLPTAAAALFTVGTGLAWILKTLVVSNPTASAVSGIQLFVDGTAAANSILGPLTLNAGATATLSDNGWAVTDADGNRLTSIAGITELTGDVTAGPGNGSVTATVVSTHLTNPLPVAQGGTGATAATGSGDVVLQDSPTFTGTVQIPAANIGWESLTATAPSSAYVANVGLVQESSGTFYIDSVGPNSTTQGAVAIRGISVGAATYQVYLSFSATGAAAFAGPIVAPSLGVNGGPTWTAGSGAPTGSGVNGSLYSNTGGGSGSTLYVYVAGAWKAIA